MATATRVRQVATRLPRFKKVSVQTSYITEIDGREKDRIVGPRYFQSVPDGYDEVPSADRVTLDLSLAEAQTLFTVVGNIGGWANGRKHTQAVYDAFCKAGLSYQTSKSIGLTGSLHFPLSPLKGTDPSSGVAGCGSLDPQHNPPKVQDPATTGSGYASDRARRDAEQRKLDAGIEGRW